MDFSETQALLHSEATTTLVSISLFLKCYITFVSQVCPNLTRLFKESKELKQMKEENITVFHRDSRHPFSRHLEHITMCHLAYCPMQDTTIEAI